MSNYYRGLTTDSTVFTEKAARAQDRYRYRGPWSGFSVVVRVDLNGYSSWARDRDIAARVRLLNQYFSDVVPRLEDHGGIYFRDEGDCIVGMFCDYFCRFSPGAILSFCKQVVNKDYSGLTPKASIACGSETAIFQKFHEQETEDWSAEGHAFVRAARLEQAIPSKARIYFFSDEFNAGLSNNDPTAGVGERYYWTRETESIQVPGLGLPGGWVDVTYFEYVAGGRVQS